jgi:hypothetical protein
MEQGLPEYDRLRLSNIAANQDFLRSFGVLDAAESVHRANNVQPRIVSMEDVFQARSSFSGTSDGWVYFGEHGGYFREFVGANSTSGFSAKLSSEVSSLGLYKQNSLFMRFELVRKLEDMVLYNRYAVNYTENCLDLDNNDAMVPYRGERIFRRLTQPYQINKYIRIPLNEQVPWRAKRGNMKYCLGNGEKLGGQGLFVKYFHSDDFTLLRAVNSSMRSHYSYNQETDQGPEGYYYHDELDYQFSRGYPCVDLSTLPLDGSGVSGNG